MMFIAHLGTCPSGKLGLLPLRMLKEGCAWVESDAKLADASAKPPQKGPGLLLSQSTIQKLLASSVIALQ